MQNEYELNDKVILQKLLNYGFKRNTSGYIARIPVYTTKATNGKTMSHVFVRFTIYNCFDKSEDASKFVFSYYIVDQNDIIYPTYYSEYSKGDIINKAITKNLNKELKKLENARIIKKTEKKDSISVPNTWYCGHSLSISAVDFNSIKVKKLGENAKLPTYGSEYAAGADLYTNESKTIKPNETVFMHTGIVMEIPKGYVGLIYARSGLACKNNLAPANKVGIIDSDYRGEIIVALHNHGTENKSVNVNDRIAQIIIQPVQHFSFIEADTLSDTDRGSGGFGSTGTK